MLMGVSDKGLHRQQKELRLTRWVVLPSACIYLSLCFHEAYASFHPLSAYAASHCFAIGLLSLWQDSPDPIHMKRWGRYQERAHILMCMVGCLVCNTFEDEHNAKVHQMISFFMIPLTAIWESRDAEDMVFLKGFLALHWVITVMYFSGDLWPAGWQCCFVSLVFDIVVFLVALGRAVVSSDMEQLSILCSTIQALLGTMCDGYCVLTGEGVIVGADRKLVSLLATGVETSTLDGMRFRQCMTEDSDAACGTSGGLRKVHFLTGEGSKLEAEVYTVASMLTMDSIHSILGRKCSSSAKSINGFLCSVKGVGTPDVDHASRADRLAEEPECSSFPAQEQQLGVPLAGLAGLRNVDEETTLEFTDDMISEPPSQVEAPAAGGLFSAIGMLGIGVGEYTKVAVVNQGSQGCVWQVRGPGGGFFAMKELHLPGVLWRRDFTARLVRADREVRCLKQLRWASGVIVQIIDCWLREDMKLCIVMDWHPMTLQSVLSHRREGGAGPPPLEDACRWLAHIVAGTAAIHSEGFMHRDIKPSNLLLTADMHYCKVADFGLSRELAEPKPAFETASSWSSDVASTASGYTRCGTRGFQSPEILQGGSYDEATDVYSIGCVLLEMLTLKRTATAPATPASAAELLAALTRRPSAFSSSNLQLPELQRLCLQTLQESAAHRPTSLGLVRADVLKSHIEALFREHPPLLRILGEADAAEEEKWTEGGCAEEPADAVGFVQLDVRGQVRQWSDGLAEVLGIPRERALSRRFLETFVPPEDRAEFSRLVGPVVRCLAPETQGPVKLQGAAGQLQFCAAVRAHGPAQQGPLRRPGQPPRRGLAVALQPYRPGAATAARAFGCLGPSLDEAALQQRDSAASVGSTYAKSSAGGSVESLPAHLAARREARTDSFGTSAGCEQNFRSWSSRDQ